MPCRICQTNAVYEFTNKARLCKDCFADYFERKIFKAIRKYQMSLSAVAENENKNDVRCKILKALSSKIKLQRKSKIYSGIKNLDDFATEIIMGVMNKRFNVKDFLPKAKREEHPLYFVSDKEIMLYAKLKGIKGRIIRKTGKEKNSEQNKLHEEISSLFGELEKSDRDVKHAVVNATIKSI